MLPKLFQSTLSTSTSHQMFTAKTKAKGNKEEESGREDVKRRRSNKKKPVRTVHNFFLTRRTKKEK